MSRKKRLTVLIVKQMVSIENSIASTSMKASESWHSHPVTCIERSMTMRLKVNASAQKRNLRFQGRLCSLDWNDDWLTLAGYLS